MLSKESFTTFEFQKPEEDTCGPISVINVLRNLGVETTLTAVLEKLASTPKDKTHAPQLALCLSQFGIDTVRLQQPFRYSG